MDDLIFLVEQTKGMNVKQLEIFYKDTYTCKIRVNEELGLFCPMYDAFRTKFNVKGARATRGTVFALDKDKVFNGTVVCLPFIKFFNSHEQLAYQGPDEEIESIQRKMDGSLIKVFYHTDRWIIASNGTPVASAGFSELFQKAIRCGVEYFDRIFNKEHTYLFELCSPDNLIVVKYTDTFATLLMIRSRLTYEELPLISVKGHFKHVAVVNAFDNTEIGSEGVVVVYKNGERVKKKTLWYKTCHKTTQSKTFEGSNWLHVLEAVYGGHYDDVYDRVPQEVRVRVDKFKECSGRLEEDTRIKLSGIGLTLEKQADKRVVVEALKTNVFYKQFPTKWYSQLVLNVLFGKCPDVFVNITKESENGKQIRTFIESFQK
jgi:hypothetical protein